MLEAFEEIKYRCEIGGLSYEELEDSLRVDFPKGTETQSIWIDYGGDAHAQWVLSEPFEDYEHLKGYDAIWSPKHQLIECSVVSYYLKSPRDIDYEELSVIGTLRELGLNLNDEEPLDSEQRIWFDVGDLSVSIGPKSNVHAILAEVLPPAEATPYLTLQIRSADVTTHAEAVELLERIGNTIFFHIDISHQVLLQLEPEWEGNPHDELAKRIKKGLKTQKPLEAVPLDSVQFEYDSEATKLYSYGRSASRMPTFQFLAYYQVLEFYFYRYLRRKADREILDLLKEPPFDQLRDADKSRLLEVIRRRYEGRKKIGVSEPDLLETTIKESVTLYDLRSYIVENDDRYKFYSSNTLPKTLSKQVIPILDTSPDHREDAAERIYDIRCRIVHTKEGFETQGPLLPSDPETEYLRHDIDLVWFLARKAIEKARKPLHT